MCECVCEKSKSESSQVGGSLIHEASFFEAVLSDVKDQVEFGCFDSGEKSEAECICKIIAEVSLLPSDALIRINKVQMQVQTVRDVYRLITHEHIVLCLEKFHQVNYEIRFIKNYFRTALYNAVLESDLHFRNKYEYDVFGGAK